MKENPGVLILVDGLRPEAVAQAPMPSVQKLALNARFAGTAQSVMPNCTLPCHFSIFHSVRPERHGITTNTYTPLVRPIPGIFEALHGAKKQAAFAYNWEELRDLGRPGSVAQSFMLNMYLYPDCDHLIAERTVEFLHDGADFVFCYLGDVDQAGHDHGWMSPQYLQTAARADECIAQVLAALPATASAIVVADHGGHERSHGTNCPEDMTVPLYIHAPRHESSGVEAPDLLDIAPTIATLCGIEAPSAWEGRSLVR